MGTEFQFALRGPSLNWSLWGSHDSRHAGGSTAEAGKSRDRAEHIRTDISHCLSRDEALDCLWVPLFSSCAQLVIITNTVALIYLLAGHVFVRFWSADGVEGNIQKYRMAFDANISLHELSDSYFVPLKTVVQANIPTGLGGVRTHIYLHAMSAAS